MSNLPEPQFGTIIYDDERLYVCLANESMVKGHTIVVWKEDCSDIHLLPLGDFEYLMDIVDCVRTALLKVLGLHKVYLLYLDEVEQVHWHLVPSVDRNGFALLCNTEREGPDISLAEPLRKELEDVLNKSESIK